MPEDSKKHAIIAPMGAFKNHVRWLMMLSYPDLGIDRDRMLSEVYPAQRTWHNWLAYEWKFRELPQLHSRIAVAHDATDINDHRDSWLFLSCDPQLCLRSYVKWNSSLNNRTIRWFLEQVERTNAQYLIDAGERKPSLVLDSSLLYQPELDPKFYHSIRHFFGLDDAYEDAAVIHSAWFHLHNKSESEMLRDLASLFDQSYDFTQEYKQPFSHSIDFNR